jgi:hypothetical protein
MMNEVYTVCRDGFRVCEYSTLEKAREVYARYPKSNGYYVLAIYRKNDDGSLSFVE